MKAADDMLADNNRAFGMFPGSSTITLPRVATKRKGLAWQRFERIADVDGQSVLVKPVAIDPGRTTASMREAGSSEPVCTLAVGGALAFACAIALQK
jgi:hypothetical protein